MYGLSEYLMALQKVEKVRLAVQARQGRLDLPPTGGRDCRVWQVH